MRILIFLSIVALGNASELFSTASKYSETLNGDQPLSVSSFSDHSDFNTHISSNLNSELPSGSFSNIPVSSTIQGSSLNNYIPVFNHKLTSADSSATGSGFVSSSGLYSLEQQQNVQSLSAGPEIGSPNGFSAHNFPNSIGYNTVLSSDSSTSYVNPSSLSGSFSLNSLPVKGQHSSLKSGSKTVEIISDEKDNEDLSTKVSTVNDQYSSFVTNNSATFAHSPTVSTQKSFSTNFAGEKSNTVLTSRFLPITDQNDNYLSKPKLTSNYNTVVSTDHAATAKPSVNILSSPTFPILTSPTPTPSSTPYTVTVTTPVPTTASTKAKAFDTVKPSSYPSTTFKTYSTPLYNNYNSIYSTPRPLNTYSRVFSTAVPVTTPVSTTAFPKTNFKTVTPSSYPSTTFKTYSTPLYNNYNSIYSTPRPLNTYSRVFSTAVPVTTPVPSSAFPNTNFKTVTQSSYPPTTFKTYSTPLYNNYNSLYSTPRPLNKYSRVPTTVTPTSFAPTTFKSYSTPFHNNFNSIYSTSGPLNTYSRVFSTPVPITSNTIKSSSVTNGVSKTENNFFKPSQYVPSIIKNEPNTYSSSVTTQSPFTFSTTSPSFPLFTSSTPTASPTPYYVSITTPVPKTAFLQENFKTVTTSPYSSTTFKPYSSSSSLPSSYNSIYSTPKPFNSYSKVFSTPVPVVSNVTSSSPVDSKYISHIFSKPYITDAKSSLYSNVFPASNNPSSPSFPILTSPAPISPTPYSVTVTTPASTSAFLKNDFKNITPTSFTSTTFKPYPTTASSPYSFNTIYSTPKTLNSYSNMLSTPAPVLSKFSSVSNGLSQTLDSGKSSVVKESQSLKPNVDLTSRFDPVYTPLSYASVSTTPRTIGTYSSTYPKSNTIHGSSFSINSEPVITQTSYSGKPSVVFPFRNINSGVYNVPVSGQYSHYSGNLSPTFKVSEKTLYSPPVPISFSSLSSKPELYPVPQLSYPSVYYSTSGKNVGLGSPHDVHPAVNFGYTVQQAPLAKEYHTVEEPVVKTWKSIDSWNVAPVSHFERHFY